MKLPEVMTVAELADYLRLPQSTLYRLAREGSIPGMKVAGQWRFHRGAVDRWLGTSRKSHDGENQPETAKAQFTSAESFDIDEHAELLGSWDIRINQLSAGPFHSTIQAVATPDMVVYEERWSRKSEASGSTPESYKDYLMLGTNVAWRQSEVDWFGKVIDDRSFALSAPGGEMEFMSPDGSHFAVMLIKPEILAQAMSNQVVQGLLDRRSIDFQAVDGRRLIKLMTSTVRKFAKKPALAEDPFEARSLESRLLEILSGCIGGADLGEAPLPVSLRKACVRDAIAYAGSSNRPLTSLDLAIAAGVSQRTLQYAFQEALEITPASYLHLHRLNSAHQELATLDPVTTSVTKIALKWGFHHPGRFSVAHRKLFDETPSETLRRSRLPPATGFFLPT